MSRVKKLHLPRPTAGIKTDVWNLPNEIESQITTLAAVLQVQQQQRTPLAREEEEDEEETDDEETSNEQLHNHELGSSAVVAPLASENMKNLKRCFLDQLAELLCYKKDAHYVTCTYLREGLDEITILASRNAAWEDKDIKLLESLAGTLEQLAARDPFDLDFKPDLERQLSEYYTPRLNYHVKQLVNILESVKGETGLVDFLRKFLSRRISSQVLVGGVKRIWANIDFRSRIEALPKANKIVQELGFIRRPIVAAETFDKAAREISNFQRVKIELLPGYKAESVTPSLSLCPQLPSERDRARLNECLRKKKWVHAEMTMVLHLMSTDSVSRTPQYLGISKKTCFMCGHFLQSLSQFQARNNHGKVYSQWRLPKSLIMPPKYCETLDNAARNLRDVMQRECALERDYHIAAVKESTISSPVAPQHMRTWSPFSRHVPDPKLQARESEWLSHHSPREITVRSSKPDRSSRDISPTSDIESGSPPAVPCVLSTPESTSIACARCTATENLSPCFRCGSTFYCSKMCQKSHWPKHKFNCSFGRPIDEVDRFIIACQTHEFPKDCDVARAFGILYFTSAADQRRLFELYCRLVKDWGVGEEELRDAWQQDKLKEFILFRSSQIPSTWIQNESHWISQQDGFAANKETDFNLVFESQKHVLKPEDQQLPYQLWKPREKLEAYVFLCQIRNGYIPDADEDNWISLGFCTARNGGETKQVEKLYRELLDRCVFEEFWRAMAESKMVDLFRKYGFGDAIVELRNFETLLSAVGTRHQSVWELKRFTRLSSPQPHRSVTVDYGFYNCRTPLELSDLRQAYTNFFAQGGDEMALHEACIQGQLAPFLESELEGLPISPELVSNPYPLQGCECAGMVFGTVCLVPQSIYGEAKKWQTQRGEKMTIMIHSDELDEASGQLYLERSKYLGLSMETQTTMINGQLVESMSGM